MRTLSTRGWGQQTRKMDTDEIIWFFGRVSRQDRLSSELLRSRVRSRATVGIWLRLRVHTMLVHFVLWWA